VADPGGYGRSFAEVYDDWYGDITDVDSTVGALAGLARGGPLLELGVGTGRIAIPLSEHCEVHGIDASPEMLSLLRDKPGGHRVALILADMADPPLAFRYRAVLVAFNTFFNLPDDESQRRCLSAVACLLEPDGRLVIEALVPAEDIAGRPRHEESTRPDGTGGSIRTLTTHVPGQQTIHGVHVHQRSDGSSVDRPWLIHYQRPAQLDSLCAEAGLGLVARWADWNGKEWAAGDDRHISIYGAGDFGAELRESRL
jgi:hypothetical protein